MEKQLFGEMPQEKRKDYLRDNCDAIEDDFCYTKSFTDQEIQFYKDQLPRVVMDLAEIEDEKKEFLDLLKEKQKPLKNEHREIITNLKYKSRSVRETCYKMVDTEGKEVGYYNKAGDLVYERPARVDEMQKTTMQVLREGTNQ